MIRRSAVAINFDIIRTEFVIKREIFWTGSIDSDIWENILIGESNVRCITYFDILFEFWLSIFEADKNYCDLIVFSPILHIQYHCFSLHSHWVVIQKIRQKTRCAVSTRVSMFIWDSWYIKKKKKLPALCVSVWHNNNSYVFEISTLWL